MIWWILFYGIPGLIGTGLVTRFIYEDVYGQGVDIGDIVMYLLLTVIAWVPVVNALIGFFLLGDWLEDRGSSFGAMMQRLMAKQVIAPRQRK